MNKYRLATMILLLLPCTAAEATWQVDGVLSPTPVTEHTCLAVELEVPAGQPLQGLTWYHNDHSVAFPRLLLMEGVKGAPPALEQTGAVLQEISGESLSWGSVSFDPPLTSSTGIIHAVFEFPLNTERTGEGLGGGPGIGYAQGASGQPGYATHDGSAWTPLHPSVQLAVEGTLGMAKGANPARSLAVLAAELEDGWWNVVGTESEAESQGEQEEMTKAPIASLATAENPLVTYPNPFNPRTQVSFYVATAGEVRVEVYDVRGRKVKSLLHEAMTVGTHQVNWSGDDDRSRAVAGGVYFVRMRTADGVHQESVALLK